MVKPIIFTITGPSCAGKSTLEKMLITRLNFAKLVSETTREKRAGEVDGDSYYFNTEKEFLNMQVKDELIESIEFDGNYYGVSVAEVERVTKLGKIIVVVVEPNGRDQIRDYAKRTGADCVSIYVSASAETIAWRFLLRFSEQAKTAGLIEISSARLAGMMTTERDWEDEAYSSIGSMDKKYDMVFAQFDESNTDFTIEKISKKADELMFRNLKAEVMS